MVRNNLSTRPFYNERLVRTVLGALALLALGLTLFNIYEVIQLQGQSRDSRDTIARNDAQARELRDKAQDVRRSIDRVKLDAVQTAAREANALIDRRTFSWTELLNYFQTTLPADVRIAGVQPQIDQEGRRLVQISVYSKRVEDVEEFMDALEKTGAFSGVLPRTEQPGDDGTLRSELQAYYTPVVGGGAAGTPSPASEPGSETSSNATPSNAAPLNATPSSATAGHTAATQTPRGSR
jgi:hypothetical protein